MRTIIAGSERFTCMTTFGYKVAAARDDGTVGIYDSVTGVMRLSLGPMDPVQEIRGSPESSILFCAHQTPSVTLWDMQTGGLIHTFILDRNAEEIAISSKGRYLACGLSDGSVEVREVTGKMEGALIWSGSPVTHFCWLEPEEQLAVSTKGSMAVWDIVAGAVLRSFTIEYPVHRMVYSQKFNHLAIVDTSPPQSAITVINPQTGTTNIPRRFYQNLTCFAFSQITEELVCGSETQGIQLFIVPKRQWGQVIYPNAMISVSSLPNGTIAGKFVGSGLQLLNVDGGYVPSPKPIISALAVHALDQGRLFAVLSTSRDRIVLLEPATMSQLLTIIVQKTHTIPNDRTAIICASLCNHIAVYYFQKKEKEYMQLWKPHSKRPNWTVEIDELPSIGGISPSGTRFATYEAARVSVWDAQDGQLQAQLPVNHTNPFDLTFDAETHFYLHIGDDRVDYAVSSSEAQENSYSLRSVHRTPSPPKSRCYDLDETREWVVSGSRRICWIPPGYIGSIQSNYCWAGCSLVMAGHNGTLRRLTFREPV